MVMSARVYQCHPFSLRPACAVLITRCAATEDLYLAPAVAWAPGAQKTVVQVSPDRLMITTGNRTLKTFVLYP